MVVIMGIASTAAGALALYRRITSRGNERAGAVFRMIRQTTGVVLAVANFIRTALDALQLISRTPAQAGAGVSLSGRSIIGQRAAEMTE